MPSPSQSEWLLGEQTEPVTGLSTTLHENINPQEVESPADRAGVGHRLRRWCYSLHIFLCILHLVLLAMLWHHPEHRFTVPFDDSIFPTGLSAFLQAFYTLYTALLVFITQRLALSASLSRRQKLTTTHDISEAWGGLGVAILTLWRQTKITASTSATLLVLLYLTCISVLHVASPTIMQFRPYNTSLGVVVTSNSTSPDPSVNLTTLGWGGITPMLPLMFSFGSSMLSTSGLVNSTLYDIVSQAGNQAIVNVSVNTSTIRANCGLLPVLSSTGGFEVFNVSASLNAIENITSDQGTLWKDEILFLHTTQYQCTMVTCPDHPLLFAISTGIELDNSVQSPVNINTTWQFTSTGGELQNSSTTIYPIACSLYALNYESTLDVQQDTLWSTMDYSNESSQGWSLWSSQVTTGNGTDSEVLNTGILAAMLAADFPTELGGPAPSLFCQQGFCPAISTLDIYLMSLLGVNASANSIRATSESSSHPSIILTPAQMEAAISQIAAELIWLAGQLGESNGGFALASTNNSATELVPKWRLNINQVPVICVVTASLILLAIACFLIASSSQTPRSSINGISVLEILWIGAHIHKLRNRFHEMECLSSKKLQAIGMIDICLTTIAKGNDLETPKENQTFKPLTNVELEGAIQVSQKLQAREQLECKTTWWKMCNCQVILGVIPTLYVWCYLLHGILVAIHIALIAVFVNHTEQHIVIPLDSMGITTALKVSLQLFYILYTVVLVFITQRLAARWAMASRLDLTSVHDIFHAWTGVGSALSSLWQQRKATVSFWMILCIMVYFACISILHISSSAIMEFQTFNHTMTNMVQSTLTWTNTSVINLQDLNWTNITPLVSIVNKLPDLSTKGLFSNIIYDIPSATPASLFATVNATTIDADCGLLSNLSLVDHNNGDYLNHLNLIVSPLGPIKMGITPMWNNTVVFVNPTNFESCPRCEDYLFFLVTTTMDFDATSFMPGSSISVGVNWTQTDSMGNWPSDSLMWTYLVGCSLNATTTLDTLDLQNGLLTSPHPADMPAHSQQWTPWLPTNMSKLNNGMSTAILSAPLSNCPVNIESGLDSEICALLSTLDVYIMETVGINVTNSALTTGSGTAPTFILGHYQFENAVSEIAAQLIWLAGHLDSGFQPDYGMSNITETTVQLQLNINIIPLGFALGASVTLFLLIFYLVGVTPLRPLAVSSLGVLETLWLESHSQCIHEHMLEVDDPSLDNLRSAGMFKVCLADEFTKMKGSNEQDGSFLMLEDE